MNVASDLGDMVTVGFVPVDGDPIGHCQSALEDVEEPLHACEAADGTIGVVSVREECDDVVEVLATLTDPLEP